MFISHWFCHWGLHMCLPPRATHYFFLTGWASVATCFPVIRSSGEATSLLSLPVSVNRGIPQSDTGVVPHRWPGDVCGKATEIGLWLDTLRSTWDSSARAHLIVTMGAKPRELNDTFRTQKGWRYPALSIMLGQLHCWSCEKRSILVN